MPTLTQRWTALRQRMTGVLEEYGQVALYAYIALALSWFAASYLAIELGVTSEGLAASAGKLAAAYALYKVTMPARIGVALLTVPLAARGVRWVQRRQAE